MWRTHLMVTIGFGGEKEEICTMCCDMGWLHLMAAPTLCWGRCPSTSKRRLAELHKLTNANGRSWLPLLEILKPKSPFLSNENFCTAGRKRLFLLSFLYSSINLN